jgi:glycosyltransferase involved in cell wall biosynthesis
MKLVHLATSPFFGGPERLMLGLALAMPEEFASDFLLFADGGKSEGFRRELIRHHLAVNTLVHDTPHVSFMIREVAERLGQSKAGLLCCHGYKADIVGLLAARRAGVHVIAMSHGWTADTLKVRLYEAADRAVLRKMERVICVSRGQADKIRRAGVRADRIVISRNAINAARFDHVDPTNRQALEAMFPQVPRLIVGAAGRLSPEKGFGVLVEAAEIVLKAEPTVGFVHFGDGPLRPNIQRKIGELGLEQRFVLGGFRSDLDRFTPHLDLSVLPSFTEGLPTVVLEAYAAGVPVVATAVGGTPEVVDDGVDGYLVPPGDPAALAGRILDVLHSDDERRRMGTLGRERIRAEFTFKARALEFQAVCEEVVARGPERISIDDSVRNSGTAVL